MEHLAVRTIAIAQEPRRGGVLGDVDVRDTSARVGHDVNTKSTAPTTGCLSPSAVSVPQRFVLESTEPVNPERPAETASFL
jgi:hypothetical protein